MITLSNIDIINELGTNLVIYPIKEQNLKASTYNFTVSKYAWNLQNKQSVFSKETNEITVYAHSTTLIRTEEVIWASSKICGTYHSKVSLVSQGLGHIGTTLDPEYIGSSLIALHNHTEKDLKLKVGIDTFTSIIFRYLKTPSSINTHYNHSGRTEILKELGIKLTEEEKKELGDNNLYQIDPEELKLQLKESEEYKKIKCKYAKKKWSWRSIKRNWIYLALFLSASVPFILYFYNRNLSQKIFPLAYSGTLVALITQAFNESNSDIKEKY